MTTAYTSLLGLALPVTGELSGTWGDTVNTAITSLLDTAVAGTTSITTDADITLSTTTGASNEARQAIILWNPASGTVTRNITAPAQSKLYTVINASGGTQSIVIRGAGPTTGVTIAKGESAQVAWNGSDFVKVGSSGGAITFTDLTVTGNTILGDASADTLTVNATSTFNAPVSFAGLVRLPSTGRSAAAALTVTNPAFLYGVASTYTDTTSSGTIAAMAPFYSIAQPTLSTSNVTTYTNAATLYIANAPVAGGSALPITNPYALYVAAGNTFLGGTLTANGTATFNGDVNLGDAGTDGVIFNGRVNSNMLWLADNTYDIGASGATRPRSLFLGTALTAGTTATVGTSLTVTGVGTTNPMYLGAGSTGITTYGLLSFNNNTAYTTTIGMYGGGGGDGNLYVTGTTGVKLRVAGEDRLTVSNLTAAFTNNNNGTVGYTATNTDVTNANSRAVFTATGGTVQTQILSIGSQGIGYVGTVSNHPFEIFTNGLSRVAISAAGLVTLGTTLPSAAATYNALTVGGTGISIAPDGNAKLQIGRYNSSGANWSYIKPDSTSQGIKFSTNNDNFDALSIRSVDGLVTLGLGTTIPGAWNSSYNALSTGSGGLMGQKAGTGANYFFGNASYTQAGGWTSFVASSMIGIFGVESDGPKVFVTGLASSAGQTLSPVPISKWNVNGDMLLAGGGTDAQSAQGRLTVISNSSTYASPVDQAIWAKSGSSTSGTIVAINAATSGNNIIHDMYQGTTPSRVGTIFYARGGDTIIYGTGSPTVSAPFNTQFSKYGVTFNSTAILSTDPNTLDDYEEGTWAPGISYGGTAATVSPVFGYYVKVGRTVTLTGYFNVGSLNGGSGNAVLTGLPFNIPNQSDFYPGFWFGYVANANFAAGYAGISGYGNIGTKTAYLGSNNNVAWQQGTSTTIPTTTQIGPFTISYNTTD